MQIVVFLRDKYIDQTDVGTDLDKRSPKKGDVIDILPDGADLGKEVYKNPDIAIIETDIINTHKDVLIENGSGMDFDINPSKIYPYRSHKIDIDALGISAGVEAKKEKKTKKEIEDNTSKKIWQQ